MDDGTCDEVVVNPLMLETLFSINSLHSSLAHTEVNHTCTSHIYTMGILYRQISTWRTEQLVEFIESALRVNKASAMAFGPTILKVTVIS